MRANETFYFDTRKDLSEQEVQSFIDALPQDQIGKLMRALAKRMIAEGEQASDQCGDRAYANQAKRASAAMLCFAEDIFPE